MATKVVMEALSPTMEEGRLVEWKKQEGEPVAVGDVLAEVETDKAVMELVARAGGTLLKQVVAAGTTVPVSRAGGASSASRARRSSTRAAAPKAGAGGRRRPQATQPTPDRSRPESMPPAPAASAGHRAPRPSEPHAARRPPAGTGQPAPVGRAGEGVAARPAHGGRAGDRSGAVSAAPAPRAGSSPATSSAAPGARQRPPPPAAARAAPPRCPASARAAPYTDVPLTQIRKTIARRLAQSIGPDPDVLPHDRSGHGARLGGAGGAAEGAKGPTAGRRCRSTTSSSRRWRIALRQHPACNAWWQDDHIRYWNEVHVSMAVAIEDGLITPVIRHADRKALREIAAEAQDLAGRARERRLKPEEYTGGTFSVSNLGMLDIDEFTAVINPPEAGILAVGRIVPEAGGARGAGGRSAGGCGSRCRATTG